jgi:hypothetical protein
MRPTLGTVGDYSSRWNISRPEGRALYDIPCFSAEVSFTVLELLLLEKRWVTIPMTPWGSILKSYAEFLLWIAPRKSRAWNT